MKLEITLKETKIKGLKQFDKMLEQIKDVFAWFGFHVQNINVIKEENVNEHKI